MLCKQVLPQIKALGASLIVLSPQLREFTAKGAAAQKLTFRSWLILATRSAKPMALRSACRTT